MSSFSIYKSPIGDITIASEEQCLTGLWFESQKFFGSTLTSNSTKCQSRIIRETECWLDDYFKGIRPQDTPPISLKGTHFRNTVWNLLRDIQYGQTASYKDITEKVALIEGKHKMSTQAVAGAISHNPISIIVPCHRIISADKSLTGYAGGIERKEFLLKLEGNTIESNHVL